MHSKPQPAPHYRVLPPDKFNCMSPIVQSIISVAAGSVPKCCGLHVPCRSQSLRQVWYRFAVDCLRNANQCPKNPLLLNGKENGKGIWNPNADLDHHQKLISSRGSRLAHACQVWSTSVSTFVSFLLTDRQNDRQNDHITSACWRR